MRYPYHWLWFWYHVRIGHLKIKFSDSCDSIAFTRADDYAHFRRALHHFARMNGYDYDAYGSSPPNRLDKPTT